MPSPLTHVAVGYVVYRVTRPHMSNCQDRTTSISPNLLGALTAFSLLPDVDTLLGVLLGDFARHHNNGTHSLITGLLVSLGMGSVIQLKQRTGFITWFTISLVCYELHVLMDYITIGRGVMLAWPLSSQRYAPTIKLFYGLRWDRGWFSTEHVLTFLSEIGLMLAILTSLRLLTNPCRGHRTESCS